MHRMHDRAHPAPPVLLFIPCRDPPSLLATHLSGLNNVTEEVTGKSATSEEKILSNRESGVLEQIIQDEMRQKSRSE